MKWMLVGRFTINSFTKVMASTSPSPKSPVAAVPPVSSFPSNSSTIPPPTLSESNQTSDTPAPSTPSNSSAPPPQSPPPPAVPAAPPPSTPSVAPPPTLSPPQPPTSSPPLLPPPTPINLPPPPLPPAPPPAKNSSVPPNLSPPPPIRGSPPKASPAPHLTTPPPLPAVTAGPPSPVEEPLAPSSDTPPAPIAKPPSNLHPPPIPPPSGSPSGPITPLVSSPPPVPSSDPPPILSPAPPNDSSSNGSTRPSPLPTSPKEKPTTRSDTHDPTAGISDAPRDAGGLKIGVVVSIGIAVGLFALSILVLAVWLTRRRKKEGSDRDGEYMLPSPSVSSQNSDSSFLRPQQAIHPMGSASNSKFTYSSEAGGVGYSKSWFTYQELAEATYGFSFTNLLGEGGFGCVYKGLLANGREVAIKQLKIGGGQGEREFKAEVEIISRVHHRHLVSLVGYCIADHQRLLVYDYVPNNTLHYHIHAEGRPVMDWETRVKVAAGAARGLAYLHEDCHPRIIHRDIKSSNILLDYNYDAQVADFGLAKLALDANTHVTTRVMGTFGYMAPEYASSGKLTEKSDVFSFGVVLLELITGRKPVDSSQPLGDESLVEWARPLLTQALDKQDFEKLTDPKLEKNFAEHEMFRMIEAAAACVRHLAAKRPRMSQVVRALDSMFEFSDLTNGMKPGQSEIFDTREQSAQIRMFRRMAFGSQNFSSEFFNHSQSSSSK